MFFIIPQNQCLYDDTGKRLPRLKNVKVDRNGKDIGYELYEACPPEELVYSVENAVTINGVPVGIFRDAKRAAKVADTIAAAARKHHADKVKKFVVPAR